MAPKKKEMKYYNAVGRRKESVARVRLYIISGKEKTVSIGDMKIKQGAIVINGMPAEHYFPSEAEKKRYLLPLEMTNSVDRFALSIRVIGGGKNGQLEAIRLGIARALCLADTAFRPLVKAEGLLTRDPRVRERRKVGTGGKARRQKQSPKR